MLFASDFSAFGAIFIFMLIGLAVVATVLGIATTSIIAARRKQAKLFWWTPLAILGWAVVIVLGFVLYVTIRNEFRHVFEG